MMSFNNMKLEELQKAAHLFEIQITENDTKKEIILKLQESGKTYAMWKRFTEGEEEVKPGEIEFGSTMLLKMTRQNPSFEVLGYRFTRTHPFQVMPQEDAQKVMDLYDGFVIATPDEAKSFYS
jgi:hypothetical protein